MTSSHSDAYWDLIRRPAVLRRAAQIVATDSRNDFQDTSLERQIFSFGREYIIDEIAASLEASRYVPEPKTSQAIPKSTYSQRPGSVLPYRDRVVCQAIIMCIAPELDRLLPESVWSWRLKAAAKNRVPEDIPQSGLFRETDISKFPFLKKKTVRKYFDPFSPWYALWPQFDRLTLSYLRNSDFEYLVVSDIAGYFENIELSILNRLLHRNLPNAPKSINLLMDHFDAWVDPLYDGSRIDRGIPQGNAISSFVGNFFLKPVDDHFSAITSLKYFRYVDDIRILARTLSEARAAALDLEDRIRGLKLNLQSAKTEVVPASAGLKMIHDDRLDMLDHAQKLVKKGGIQSALAVLNAVKDAPGSCSGRTRIKGSSPPLLGLNLRVFKRWANMHLQVGSPEPIVRLVREAKENPNFGVIKDIEKIAHNFPKRKQAPHELWKHLMAQKCIFPMQEAELVRILRYFAFVPDDAYRWASTQAESAEAMPYLRMQAVFLLSRFPGFWLDGPKIVDSCLGTSNTRAITAGIVAASLSNPHKVAEDIRKFEYLSSPQAIRLIRYLRALRRERSVRRQFLGYVFENAELCERRLYEYSYLLRFIVTEPIDGKSDFRKFSKNIEKRARMSGSGADLVRFLRNV